MLQAQKYILSEGLKVTKNSANPIVEQPKMEGHIFYFSENQQKYIENAASFIVSGIERGGCVLLIENEKIMALLRKRIARTLTKEQLKKVLSVNNYDYYYYSRGAFDTPSIVSYFSKLMQPYVELNLPIFTWAHIEWNDEQEITSKIISFEKSANNVVTSMKLLSICAYNADRLTLSMKESLMEHHDAMMTDDGLVNI